MSTGPIPWTSTRAWAERHHVSDIGRFEHLIERLDGAYLTQRDGKAGLTNE